jgi:hypothetical protein
MGHGKCTNFHGYGVVVYGYITKRLCRRVAAQAELQPKLLNCKLLLAELVPRGRLARRL